MPVAGTGLQLGLARDDANRASLAWDAPLRGCERRKGFALRPQASVNRSKSTLVISRVFCREDARSVCTEPRAAPEEGGRAQPQRPRVPRNASPRLLILLRPARLCWHMMELVNKS